MFYTAISGLNAFRQQLGVISDNIANSQTRAFKSGEVSFSEVMSPSFASASGSIGNGVSIQDIGLGWIQGATSSTGNPTDFAITGSGFFIVRDTDGTTGYTRDGQFLYNATGDLINAAGMNVQGYAIDPTTGIVSNAYSNINISTAPVPAVPTSTMSTTVNLDSSAAIGAASVFSTTTNIYDSLGNAIPLTITYQKTAANTWSYTPSIPAAMGTVTSAAGTLTFNAGGALVIAADPAISFTLSGGATSPQTVTWDLSDGVATNGTITQYSGTSGLFNVYQNGTATGEIKSVTTDTSGVITASYSNGLTRPMYQIALADFQNYDGLLKTASNLYKETPSSGTPLPGTAGTGRFGLLATSSLEASNVDMAKEMGNMILAQRSYESCARVFTTESEMLTTIVNMAR